MVAVYAFPNPIQHQTSSGQLNRLIEIESWENYSNILSSPTKKKPIRWASSSLEYLMRLRQSKKQIINEETWNGANIPTAHSTKEFSNQTMEPEET